MRRKDREMDRAFGLAVIDRANYATLSLVDQALPYGVPLSIVRLDDKLYFHAAKVGRKAEILAKNNNVSICFVGRAAVPEKYQAADIEAVAQDREKVSKILGNVFTTEFESAIVTGKASLVVDDAEKVLALRAICQKYTPTKMAYADMAIEASFAQVALYRIDIVKLTAKRKEV